MTGLGLAVGEELSSAFELYLIRLTNFFYYHFLGSFHSLLLIRTSRSLVLFHHESTSS
jgi:hypothetical protein